MPRDTIQDRERSDTGLPHIPHDFYHRGEFGCAGGD